MFSSWFGPKEVQWQYPDWPTPETDEDLLQLAEKHIDQLKQWHSEGTELPWEFFHEEQGVKCWAKPGQPVEVVRAQVTIESSAEDLARLFWDAPFEIKKKFHPMLLEQQIVKSVNENVEVGRSMHETPSIISNREFVSLKVRHYGDNITILGSHSINYKECPFIDAGTRGAGRSGAVIVSVGDNLCELTTYDQVDPKGMIPGWVVSMFKKGAAQRLASIAQMKKNGEI